MTDTVLTASGRCRDAKGRYVSDPAKPPKRRKHAKAPRTPTAPLAQPYAQCRGAALRLMKHLTEMMPPERKASRRAGPGRAEPLAPEYERLLSKGQGVIDAFETLGLLVVRLIDKEREVLDQATEGVAAYPRIDEADLDRRYREELDRICNPRAGA
jgi:hypothetical protein